MFVCWRLYPYSVPRLVTPVYVSMEPPNPTEPRDGTENTENTRKTGSSGGWKLAGQGMAAVAGPHCELPGVPLASSSGLAYAAVKMKLACRLAAPPTRWSPRAAPGGFEIQSSPGSPVPNKRHCTRTVFCRLNVAGVPSSILQHHTIAPQSVSHLSLPAPRPATTIESPFHFLQHYPTTLMLILILVHP